MKQTPKVKLVVQPKISVVLGGEVCSLCHTLVAITTIEGILYCKFCPECGAELDWT